MTGRAGGRHVRRWGILAFAVVMGIPAITSAGDVKLDGYLECRKPGFMIIDGQRVRTTSRTRLQGSGKARNAATIPLGYEIKGTGSRRSDGTITALSIEARPNRTEMFENQVLQSTAQAEQAYLKASQVYETGRDGKQVVVGALHDSGPQVERARAIVDRLLPSYVSPMKVRVYVVDNDEWNAMAMANFSIYVFSGLMDDLDDDELAVVLGHEITHATYEHSRRQAVKGMAGGLAGAIVSAGAQLLDSPLARTAVQGAAVLGSTTFSNAYSREYEDQADRVGLRYVYEAGYDYHKAPRLWRRFAKKYGDSDKVTNFFFGDHSLSSKRAQALEREIANNYRDPAKDPPTHSTSMTPPTK